MLRRLLFLLTVDSSVYQAKLIGWTLVVFGTSQHPYNPTPSTAPPIPQHVVNHLAPPAATPPYDFIHNQNVHRPRFLPPDGKAIKVGPCRRPVQVLPPLPSFENGIASYSINDLPASLSGRGKTNVLQDGRGGKEGSRSREGTFLCCLSGEWGFTSYYMVTFF